MHRLHVLPPPPDEFWSSFTGEDFFEDMHDRSCEELRATHRGSLRGRGATIETALGLLPIPDNDYNPLAIAVVAPLPDGSLERSRQIGWVPDRRVRSLQPRIVSLMEATGDFVGVPARSDGTGYRYGLTRWEDIHEYVLPWCHEAYPDRVQPWVTNRARGSDLSRSIYESAGGPQKVEVVYTIDDGDLVATIDGQVFSNLTAGGRDFFDLLRARVASQGPVRGYAVAHRTAVEILHEDIP